MLKAIKETSVKVRRQFDQTFKREAVQNWLASGKSAQVIAKELGLLPNRLYAWRKRFAPAWDASEDVKRCDNGDVPNSSKIQNTDDVGKSNNPPSNQNATNIADAPARQAVLPPSLIGLERGWG